MDEGEGRSERQGGKASTACKTSAKHVPSADQYARVGGAAPAVAAAQTAARAAPQLDVHAHIIASTRVVYGCLQPYGNLHMFCRGSTFEGSFLEG